MQSLEIYQSTRPDGDEWTAHPQNQWVGGNNRLGLITSPGLSVSDRSSKISFLRLKSGTEQERNVLSSFHQTALQVAHALHSTGSSGSAGQSKSPDNL